MTLQKASLLAAVGAAVGLAAVCAYWISMFGSWISMFGWMKPSAAPWYVFVVSSVLTINLARGLALLLFFILTYREIKGFPAPTALRAVCLTAAVFCAIGLALASGSVLELPANRMPVPTPVRFLGFLGMFESALMTYFYLLLFRNPLAALPARKRSWIALTIAITSTISLVVVSVSAVETLLSASPGLPTYEPAPPLAIGPLVGSLFSGVTFILFFFTLYKHPPLAPLRHVAPGESGTVPAAT